MPNLIYTLGADPEFFIELPNGQMKAITGLIGGSKHNPLSIDDHGDFKIQEDNVAAEYNIPPSYTKEQFIQHILWPQQYIAHLLGTDRFVISKKASASFPKKELKDPRTQEFGCDPDFDIWKQNINEKPQCKDKTFRTCGGHIHIGLDDKSPENITRIIRNMDHYLGVWSVIVDQDKKRRQLYGKAGCFRPQPHGVEYRTLSNFWIFSPETISEVWDRTQAACNAEIEHDAKLIQDIINNGNIDAAKQYLQANGL